MNGCYIKEKADFGRLNNGERPVDILMMNESGTKGYTIKGLFDDPDWRLITCTSFVLMVCFAIALAKFPETNDFAIFYTATPPEV